MNPALVTAAHNRVIKNVQRLIFRITEHGDIDTLALAYMFYGEYNPLHSLHREDESEKCANVRKMVNKKYNNSDFNNLDYYMESRQKYVRELINYTSIPENCL